MPKIPVYEQQRLASSVVGTPGVDNSAATLMGNISQGLQQTTNSLLSAAGQQYYADLREQRRLAAEQRAREKATQELLDKSEIANHVYQADSLLGDLETKTKEAGLNDPRAAAGSFDTQAKEALDKYFESQPTMSQEVREGVRVKLLERIKSRQEGMRDWGYTTQVANAAAQVHANFMDFASRAGKDTSPEAITALFGQIDAYYQEQLPLMGPKIQDDYRAAKEGAMVNYTNAVAQESEDPEKVKQAVMLPIFDDIAAAKKNSVVGRSRELQAQQTVIRRRQEAYDSGISFLDKQAALQSQINENTAVTKTFDDLITDLKSINAPVEQISTVERMKQQFLKSQAATQSRLEMEKQKTELITFQDQVDQHARSYFSVHDPASGKTRAITPKDLYEMPPERVALVMSTLGEVEAASQMPGAPSKLAWYRDHMRLVIDQNVKRLEQEKGLHKEDVVGKVMSKLNTEQQRYSSLLKAQGVLHKWPQVESLYKRLIVSALDVRRKEFEGGHSKTPKLYAEEYQGLLELAKQKLGVGD